MTKMTLLILTLALCFGVQAPAANNNADDQWNQYRGPNRDGISPDKGLLKSWPEDGPPLEWKTDKVGGGYSSVSLWDDRIFTMGDIGSDCYVICVSAKDGKELWKTRVCPAGGHRGYPGPRSTPATDGKIVVALGNSGDLICVDAKTGRKKWNVHMERDLGGQMMSGWKWSESPLIDGNLVVVTPGGNKGAVAALNKANGRLAWQSAGIKGDSAAYTSLVPIKMGRAKLYMVLTDKSIAAVSTRNGAVGWKANREGKTAVAATPIYKDGFVFTTSGYNVGCNGFRVSSSGGGFRASEIYSGRQMANHHGGCILVGNHVYGVDDRGSIKCIDIRNGKELWASDRVGKGSVAYADGHIIYRGENQRSGTVKLVEATPKGYKEKGSFDQPDLSGKQTWAHPVVFGGKLYLRDQGTLLCYNLKKDE